MSRQRPRTQIKTSAAKCQKPLLYEKQVRRSRRNYITTRHRYAASCVCPEERQKLCVLKKLDECVFITAGPMIKLCAGGEGDSEGHVL